MCGVGVEFKGNMGQETWAGDIGSHIKGQVLNGPAVAS